MPVSDRSLHVTWVNSAEILGDHGQMQLYVKQRTIGRFVAFIERIGRLASQSELRFLEGLDISTQQIKEYKTTAIWQSSVVEFTKWLEELAE